VRAYYAVEGTYADADYSSVYGTQYAKENDNTNAIVMEYSLSNYPNPFNPTTQINYSLKEDGFVTVKIYDVIGNEITTLVNEPKSIGSYDIKFNASNLPSGVYLCTIKVIILQQENYC